jgi:hypothetical protein
MRLSEIEKKARSLGVKDTWKFSKKDLVREIQRKEGNFPCFATTQSYCDQKGCSWRMDCLK